MQQQSVLSTRGARVLLISGEEHELLPHRNGKGDPELFQIGYTQEGSERVGCLHTYDRWRHSDPGKLKVDLCNVIFITKEREPILEHENQAPTSHKMTNVLSWSIPKPCQFHRYWLTVEAGQWSSSPPPLVLMTPLGNFCRVILYICSPTGGWDTLFVTEQVWRVDDLWSQENT